MSNLLAQGQERFIVPLGNYTTDQSCNKLEYQTGQNAGGQKRAGDVVVYGTASISTGNAIEAGSTQRVIKKTAHGARKNDVVQFTTGNNAEIAIQILSCPDVDTMILAATPEFTSAVGDLFDLKRYVSPLYALDGSLSVGAPVGGATSANQTLQITQETLINTNLGTDITTPTAMPAGGAGVRGWLSAIWTKLNGSLAVTGAFFQATQPVSGTITQIETPKALTYVQSLTLDGTTAQTFSPPANAKNVKIHAGADNTVDLIIAFGGTTATDTVGEEFEAGRSEDYQGVSAISVICKSAITAHKVSIIWST